MGKRNPKCEECGLWSRPGEEVHAQGCGRGIMAYDVPCSCGKSRRIVIRGVILAIEARGGAKKEEG